MAFIEYPYHSRTKQVKEARLDSRLSGELFYGQEMIRRNKKLKAFTSCHGGVVGVRVRVRMKCFKSQGD